MPVSAHIIHPYTQRITETHSYEKWNVYLENGMIDYEQPTNDSVTVLIITWTAKSLWNNIHLMHGNKHESISIVLIMATAPYNMDFLFKFHAYSYSHGWISLWILYIAFQVFELLISINHVMSLIV